MKNQDLEIEKRIDKNPIFWFISAVASGAIGCFAVIVALSSFFGLTVIQKDSFIRKDDSSMKIMTKKEYDDFELRKAIYEGTTELSQYRSRYVSEGEILYILGNQIKLIVNEIDGSTVHIIAIFPDTSKKNMDTNLNERTVFQFLGNKYFIDIDRISINVQPKGATISITKVADK
jgi:hypothetical protein